VPAGNETYANVLTGEKQGMSPEDNVKAHWAETTRLTYIMIGIWAFFSFFIHMFSPALNGIKIMGFPLGFYMAAQGSLIIFVAQLFWFAKAQDKVDRKYGMAEED
jgi:putative solute:sodium symporter small subunit